MLSRPKLPGCLAKVSPTTISAAPCQLKHVIDMGAVPMPGRTVLERSLANGVLYGALSGSGRAHRLETDRPDSIPEDLV